MRKPLPSRTAVLDLLKSQDRALDAREVAERLGVLPASQAGLLRMLDDLVFDGVVTARGDKFKLGTSDKVPEKAPALVAKAVHPAAAAARTADTRERNPRERDGKKGLKGLPKDVGKGAKGRQEARRGNEAHSSPDARAHAQEARRGRQDARQEERGMPKFQVAGGSAPSARAHEARPDTTAPTSTGSTGARAPARSGGRSDRERREGFLKVNPRGFGFVASPTASGDDVYVSPENLGGAMHGDHVIIDIVARGARGPEGHIVQIKARGSQRVSGILRRRGKSA